MGTMAVDCAQPDTSSDVIHNRAVRAPSKPSSRAIVNNSAACDSPAGSPLASRRSRSSQPKPLKLGSSSPACVQALSLTSERIRPHDGPVSGPRKDGAGKRRPPANSGNARNTKHPMTPFNELTTFAGLDWASDHHDLFVVDKSGSRLEGLRFDHTAQGWKHALERLQAHGVRAVAIETKHGIAVQQLLEGGFIVYPVVPKAAARYRGRKAPSGVKDDQLDAWSLADALRVDGHEWRPLSGHDPLVSELRLLCADEELLIGQRTQLVNQLQAALREYYPAALEAFDDWTTPATWRFVIAFSTPGLLRQAGRRKWEKFLHANKLWRPQTSEKRLEIFARTDGFEAGAAATAAKSLLAVSVAKMLQAVETQLMVYRSRIEKLFADHPQSRLFGSLPGAGPKIAPRLLSLVLHRMEEGVDTTALQSLAGTAPVTIKSGQITKRKIRRDCDKNLRNTVHLWSNLSRVKCRWAEVYYRSHREKGKSHACALRCLGQRWLKILAAMCRNQQSYDEGLHASNQAKHGSWVLALNPVSKS